jgi:hypothetical protein
MPPGRGTSHQAGTIPGAVRGLQLAHWPPMVAVSLPALVALVAPQGWLAGGPMVGVGSGRHIGCAAWLAAPYFRQADVLGNLLAGLASCHLSRHHSRG